jgi:predicted glycosyltransferase
LKLLVDIVHPADVLFFKRPLETWLQRGDDIRMLSRRKDVTCDLLDEFGFLHEPVSSAGRGIFGLARELVLRDNAVVKAARSFRPEAMIGFGGVSISHAGKLLGIPAIAFYDTEYASLQNRITWPFISRLYVPESYSGPTPRGRTHRIPGTKELSYLHPSAFQPDRDIAMRAGLVPAVDNFLVRVVEWRANHDIAKYGWDESILRTVVSHLSARGKVHISSECELPPDLNSMRYRGSVTMIHHLLAACRMLVGESNTLASEAAVLGVPAICCGHDFPGYVQDLGRAGLVCNIPRTDRMVRQIIDGIEELLEEPRNIFIERRDQFVSTCPDWSQVIVDAVDSISKVNG